MSSIYFSFLDGMVTMGLFIEEAEDLYSDLLEAISSGNTSENIKGITKKLGKAIELGKRNQER